MTIFKEVGYFQMGSEQRMWCNSDNRTEQSIGINKSKSICPWISCLQLTRTSLINAEYMSLSGVCILSLQYTQPWPTLQIVSASKDI